MLVADAGYWHQVQMQQVVEHGVQFLIPPTPATAKGARRGWNGALYAFMRRVLQTNLAGDLYRKRKGMIEPYSVARSSTAASIASNAAAAAQCARKWRLITATHNLLKLPPTS